MSKFLKFIVHFIVICTIICVVGLAVPPFLGITTEILDDSSKETNLPMGSVTYAIPVKTEEAAVGDSILYQGDSKAYKYMITEIDQKNKTFQVIDASNSKEKALTVQAKEYFPKVVITIGYVGYLLIATESIEGLIILGLAVLFLIILYIIAELWKKDPQDDYDEMDTEPGYVKSKKELKREEKARQGRYKEEEKQIRKEEKQNQKGADAPRKKIRTGGFVDTIYEHEQEPDNEKPVTVQTATSEAHELLKKEIAAATADEPEAQQEEPEKEVVISPTENIVTHLKEALEEEKQEPEAPVDEEEETESLPIRRMAIPVWSAAQIAESAKNQGDAPDIVKDDITKVTLFDYSDIVAGAKPASAEKQN